jgi:uncharacterized membrane protein
MEDTMGAVPPKGRLARLVAGFTDHIPVWFFWLTSLITMHSSLAYLNPPRYDFTWTIAFPWTIIFLYFYAHCQSSGKYQNPFVPPAILAFISLACFSAIYIYAKPVGITTDQFKWRYEIYNMLWVGMIIAHCIKFRGFHGFLRFFIIAGLYGFLLESSGVQRGFFFEDRYHIYLTGFDAPLVTMIGWSTVFYPCTVIFEKVTQTLLPKKKIGILPGGLIISLMALCFDLQLDPFASAYGLWQWNKTLPPWFLGVPFLNFVSWFWAVLMFGVAYLLITRRENWAEWKKQVVFLLAIPIIQSAAGKIW